MLVRLVLSSALPIHLQLCPLLLCYCCKLLQGYCFCFLDLLDLKWSTLKLDFASAEVRTAEVEWIPPSKYCVIVVIQEVCVWVICDPCDKLSRSGGTVRTSWDFLSCLFFFFFLMIFTLMCLFLNCKKSVLKFQHELVPCSVEIF